MKRYTTESRETAWGGERVIVFRDGAYVGETWSGNGRWYVQPHRPNEKPMYYNPLGIGIYRGDPAQPDREKAIRYVKRHGRAG